MRYKVASQAQHWQTGGFDAFLRTNLSVAAGLALESDVFENQVSLPVALPVDPAKPGSNEGGFTSPKHTARSMRLSIRANSTFIMRVDDLRRVKD